MKNVWAELHPLQEGETACNLGDYTLVATNDLVTTDLQEGLKLAQGMLRILNMAPSIQCSNKDWFLIPWLMEKDDPSSFAYVPSKTPVQGEDGDAEVLRNDLEATAIHEASTDSNSIPSVDGEEEISKEDSPTVTIVRDSGCDLRHAQFEGASGEQYNPQG